MSRLRIIFRHLPDGQPKRISGRDAWALAELHKAGMRGCTPIDNPGPRWSAYVFNLRSQHGLQIETRHEPHRGNFPGTHARYVLLSQVEILSRSDAQDDAA